MDKFICKTISMANNKNRHSNKKLWFFNNNNMFNNKININAYN